MQPAPHTECISLVECRIITCLNVTYRRQPTTETPSLYLVQNRAITLIDYCYKNGVRAFRVYQVQATKTCVEGDYITTPSMPTIIVHLLVLYAWPSHFIDEHGSRSSHIPGNRKGINQPDKVANPVHGQLKKESDNILVPVRA